MGKVAKGSEKAEKDKQRAKKPRPVFKPKQQPDEEIKIIRLSGSDIHGNKRIEHALTGVKGVSWAVAGAIRKAAGFENKKIGDLSDEELNKLKDVLSNPQKHGIPTWLFNKQKDRVTGKDYHLLSSDLLLSNRMEIEFLKKLRTYVGVRHMFKYKVRGQRTRSRGANVKGRVGSTVGVVKKKQAPQKKK